MKIENTIAVILFLSSFICSRSGLANPASCELLKDTFQLSFDDRDFYRFGECASNASKLLRKFETQGGNLSETSVLLILHESRKIANGPTMPTPLRPQRRRAEALPGQLTFDYHVAAFHNQRVYDYDFSASPTLVSTYVTEMFDRPSTDKQDPNEQNILNRIWLIEIPAPDYLAKWQEFESSLTPPDPSSLASHVRAKVISHFRKEAGAKYPLKRMSEYLP